MRSPEQVVPRTAQVSGVDLRDLWNPMARKGPGDVRVRSNSQRRGAAALFAVALGALALTAGCAGRDRPSADDRDTPVPVAPPRPAQQPPVPPPSGPERYVAMTGDDSASGAVDAPWRTLQHAFESLRPGDRLYVRGGTYVEDVDIPGPAMHQGSAEHPIWVQPQPGEEVVLQGLLWLTNPSYWHLDGINVTWASGHRADQHMVKLIGGTGWSLTGAELSHAHSYAALLIGGGATAFRVAGNFVHDTHPSNAPNQDHLIYVDNGPDGSGVIERNVLARSPNGRGVKLGPGSLEEPGTSHIVIRYNTFFDNRGPSNVQLSGSSSDNLIVGNLFHTAGRGSTNVSGYRLSGTGNVVADNLGWQSQGVADFSLPGLVDGGGNVSADPVLVDPGSDDFNAILPNADTYGAPAVTTRAVARGLAGPSPAG